MKQLFTLLCQPILLAFVLPCSITYLHLQSQLLYRSPLLQEQHAQKQRLPNYVVVVIPTFVDSANRQRHQSSSLSSSSSSFVGIYKKEDDPCSGKKKLSGEGYYIPIQLTRHRHFQHQYRFGMLPSSSSSSSLLWYMIHRHHDYDMTDIADFVAGKKLSLGSHPIICQDDDHGNAMISAGIPYLSWSSHDGYHNLYFLRYATHESDDVIIYRQNMTTTNSVTGYYDYHNSYHRHYNSSTNESRYSTSHNNEVSLLLVMSVDDYYSHDSGDDISASSRQHRHHRDRSLTSNPEYRNESKSMAIFPNDRISIEDHHDDHINEHRILLRSMQQRKQQPRNQNYRNKFWYQTFVLMPCTTLVILLHIVIAFYYWNDRISPEVVGKIYHNMMHPPYYEIWRCFTGMTAHFDMWHLGINMMSLYSLGHEIEHNLLYTSLSFFLYNIALIPIVCMMWLLLMYLEQYYVTMMMASTARGAGPATTSNRHIINTMMHNHYQHHHHIPAVGFSGILFTWMVIASLEQSQTCPIFFIPSLCFPTYTIGYYHIKWSFSPIVQLIMIQILLPRVSFTGHLAGMIIGFLLHWGLLPIYYIQPSITIPLLYILYLRYIRNIPLPFLLSSSITSDHNNNDDDDEPVDFITRKISISFIILVVQFIILFMSLLCFGPFSSYNISYLITIIFWYWTIVWNHMYYHRDNNNNLNGNSSHIINNNSNIDHYHIVLARGFVVSAVLVMVTDAMNFGSWMILSPFLWYSRMSCITILFRSFILLISILYVTVNRIIGDDHGIFEFVFGYTIIQPFRILVREYPWFLRIFQERNNTGHQEELLLFPSTVSSLHNSNNHPSIARRNITPTTTTTTTTTTMNAVHDNLWVPFHGQGRVLGGGMNRNN